MEDIGLVAALFNDERLGSPGILVKGCLVGSKTMPLPPGVLVDVGSRDISTGEPGIIG